MGGCQSSLFLWDSFAGEGAAGGRRLGRGRVAGSLVAAPWLSLVLMLGLEVEVEVDREANNYLSKPPWSGWRAGREGFAIEVGSRPVQSLSTEETSSIQSLLLSRMHGRLWKQECFRQTQKQV